MGRERVFGTNGLSVAVGDCKPLPLAVARALGLPASLGRTPTLDVHARHHRFDALGEGRLGLFLQASIPTLANPETRGCSDK